MSSIRKFRDLASIAIKAAIGDQHPDKAKHLDSLLTGLAELLDGEDAGRTHQLSTVAEMAFGNPSMMMGSAFEREIPYPFGAFRPHGFPTEDPTFAKSSRGPEISAAPEYRAHYGDSHGVPTRIPDVRSGEQDDSSSSSREPRLIIHESPTVKVTKVGSDLTGPSMGEQGTTLDSLFLGLDSDARRYAIDGESMAGIDHESIRSEDVGVCCDDEEDGEDDEDDEEDEEDNDAYPRRSTLDTKAEEQEQELELDDKILTEYEGKPYFRGIKTHKVYKAEEEGSSLTPGACIGVWVQGEYVPLQGHPSPFQEIKKPS